MHQARPVSWNRAGYCPAFHRMSCVYFIENSWKWRRFNIILGLVDISRISWRDCRARCGSWGHWPGRPTRGTAPSDKQPSNWREEMCRCKPRYSSPVPKSRKTPTTNRYRWWIDFFRCRGFLSILLNVSNRFFDRIGFTSCVIDFNTYIKCSLPSWV